MATRYSRTIEARAEVLRYVARGRAIYGYVFMAEPSEINTHLKRKEITISRAHLNKILRSLVADGYLVRESRKTTYRYTTDEQFFQTLSPDLWVFPHCGY